MTRRVIFAEGPQDVYFWSGLAERLGWARAPRRANLPAGQHELLRSGASVRIAGCGGKDRPRDERLRQGVLAYATDVCQEYSLHLPEPTRCLINFDGDAADDEVGMQQKLDAFAQAQGLVATANPRVWRSSDQGLDVTAVVWSGAGHMQSMQACLERLVTDALHAVGPEASESVQRFIASRQAFGAVAPSAAAKASLGAFRAGWFASFGDGAFLKQLWSVPAIAEALETSLRQDGEWARIERFFQD